MLSQLVFERCVTSFLFLTFASIVTTNNEHVVEVNEKDLNDRGININLSDIDLLQPVINPLRKSSPTSRPFSQSHTINTDHPNFEKQNNNIKSTDHKGKIAKSKKLHQNQLYYNIYDLDQPITIKKAKKLEPSLTKEKQEILNNTLSHYDLRLDAKGKTIILKDDQQKPLDKIKKYRNNKEDDSREGFKVLKDEIKERKNSSQDPSKKADKQDPIKSLWDIVKSVSRKWK